jgi:hypothetical protein
MLMNNKNKEYISEMTSIPVSKLYEIEENIVKNRLENIFKIYRYNQDMDIKIQELVHEGVCRIFFSKKNGNDISKYPINLLDCYDIDEVGDFISKENNDCSPMVAQMTAMNETQFYEMQKQAMPRLLQDASKLEMVVDWSVKSDRKTFAQMYCDFFNTDLRERISTVKCPSLILLASNFINLKPAIEEQYKNLKTANFQYANKGLHFIMYDDKDWYLVQLNNFIKS